MYLLLSERIDVEDISLPLLPLVHGFACLPSSGPQYYHITADAKPPWSITHCEKFPVQDHPICC